MRDPIRLLPICLALLAWMLTGACDHEPSVATVAETGSKDSYTTIAAVSNQPVAVLSATLYLFARSANPSPVNVHRVTAPWEEAVRIPFIIGGHTPRYANKDGAVSAPLNHVDIAPTTLGLCGIDAPAWMEGTDYSGYRIRDREVSHEPDSAYLQLVIPTMHGDSVDRPWRGLVTRDGWKYVVLEGQPWLLFNLNEDPYEQVNLAYNTAFARERRALHARLAQWVAETGDAFALPDV